eukprot:jgi/Mesvir1/149/Mv13513-RA.1
MAECVVYVLEGEHMPEDECLTSRWNEIRKSGIPWSDDAFPPDSRSLEGKNLAVGASARQAVPAASTRRVVSCRCNVPCARTTVKKDPPDTECQYYYCAARRCGFFAWANSQATPWSTFAWSRFPQYVVVTDTGFKASDLQQGGVGDCWFLSALAVVAERGDLIAKLFADTAPNAAGCYLVRLFLDGDWRSILVDAQLPITNRPRHRGTQGALGGPSLDTFLAFSRADHQQLWAPLLEKAYAKAHGSYRAIAGGQVAEALLDLTGAPVFTVEMDYPGFSLDALWAQLVYFKSQKFPMGCATAPNPHLEEMGLVGNHAYSILECREVQLKEGRCGGRGGAGGGGNARNGAGGTAQRGNYVRLLRIRNPHGVGEWSGAWSDASSSWATLLSPSGLQRTGVNDGTFWMDLTHFVMGFSIVDVCFAFQDWHARSLPNAFCVPTSPWRVCQHTYRVQATQPTLLYLMALQPASRGADTRADRKKSYRPGDLSLLVARLDPDGNIAEVVGGGLHGAGNRNSRRPVVATLDDPASDYLVIAFNLGTGPLAAEVTQGAPFTVRFFASAPLVVTQHPFREWSDCDTCRLLTAFHQGLLYLLRCEEERRRQQIILETASHAHAGTSMGRHAPRWDPCAIVHPRVRWHWSPLASAGVRPTRVPAASGASPWKEGAAGRPSHSTREVARSSGQVLLVDVQTEGVVGCLVVNRGPHAVHVEVCANAKGMVARGSHSGLLQPDASAPNEPNPKQHPTGRAPPGPPLAPADGGFNWMKWERFRHTVTIPGTQHDVGAGGGGACASVAAGRRPNVPPGGQRPVASNCAGHQCLALLLVATGGDYKLGKLTAHIVHEGSRGVGPSIAPPVQLPGRSTRGSGGGAKAVSSACSAGPSGPQNGLFSPVPLLDDLAVLLDHLDSARHMRQDRHTVDVAGHPSAHDAAAALLEDAALAAALAASVRDCDGIPAGKNDAVELSGAIAASLEGHPSATPSKTVTPPTKTVTPSTETATLLDKTVAPPKSITPHRTSNNTSTAGRSATNGKKVHVVDEDDELMLAIGLAESLQEAEKQAEPRLCKGGGSKRAKH